MTYQLIRGDATALPIEDDSVDAVITSPPYYSLRSYTDGGEHYVIEAKNRRGYAVAEAVDQAKAEAANAGSTFPVAVLKRNGVGDIGRSFVVLELDDWLALLPRPF